MKKTTLLLLFLMPVLIFGQNIAPFEVPPSFMQNKGQFDGRNWQKNHIEYAVDYDDSYIFFTKKGLTYRFDKIIRNPERSKTQPDCPKRINISELVHITWVDANEDVKIIAYDEVSGYYSYAIKNLETDQVKNENHINGYSRLLYKNLYDNIDVEYVFHPETGIKYSVILHPGADLSKVKMKYSYGTTNTKDEFVNINLLPGGDFEIKSSQASITEHKPITFYNDSREEIPSAFVFENNILSFQCESYDNSRKIIIDPWVDAPNFTTSTAVWEVETDSYGNVFVIGGETPMELRKYNAAGAWQWTYVTPWDTASVWLGTLATNADGTSFVTSGTDPEIERVNSAGTMVFHNASGFPAGGLNTEYWTIAFNCDKTRLIVGGTGGNLLDFSANIYNMDINTGDVLDIQTVHTGGSGGFMNHPIEVRSISSSKNSKYIFLTHFHVGAIMDNFGACPNDELVYKIPGGHDLGYKCENYLPATQNGGGLKALIANDAFIYTNAGDVIYKRNLSDGSLVTSVALPGGNSSTVPLVGGLVVENSGMAVDECGNVYAGSGDRVVKFDADLNILDQAIVGFTVYDVSVNSNSEVLAVGAMQDNESTNRNGRVAAVALNACDQFGLICCDVNICPMEAVCDDLPPFDITVSSLGGTFSGPGITNTTTGTFDPSLVGPGTYTIVYTKACGADSITITVLTCEPLDVCYDGTNLVATGGTGTITWEDWETFNYPITNEAECIACPTASPIYFMGFYIDCSESDCSGSDWVQFATGSPVAPPSNWPMQVSDINGVAFTFNNIGEIPACPVCPAITVAVTPVDPTCYGFANGSATASGSGGSSPYSYEWSDVAGQTTATATGLGAGNYTVTVTDNDGCTGTQSVTINQPTALTATISGPLTFCPGGYTTLDAGAGYSVYNWSPTGNTQTINVNVGGTYSVTVTNSTGCTASASVTVTGDVYPSPVITGDLSFCTGTSTTLDAGAGYNDYDWSNSATSQTITVTAAGTYIVTVTDVSGCTGTGEAIVTEIPNPEPDIAGILEFCTGLSTNLSVSGYVSYLWTGGSTADNITVTMAGDYSVTVTDSEGCTGTESVTVNEVSGLSPEILGDSIICDGETAVFDAGAGYADYEWSTGGDGQTINATGAGDYFVTVSDAAGCSGTDQITLVVYPSPDPEIIGTTTICEGGSTVLGLDETYPGYLWSDGVIQPTTVVDEGGIYSVTVTNSDGCTATDMITVTVLPSPDATINGDLTICFGETTDLSVATGYTTYVWSTSETTTSINVDTGGDYSVTITGSNGCSSTETVTVSQSGEINPEIMGTATFCEGDYSTLSAGSGYYSYQWAHGPTSEIIVVTDDGTYAVTVTDANGCSGSTSIKITVLPRPVPDILGNTNICAGEQTSLYLGTVFDSYTWSTGALDSSITVSSEGLYYVTVSNSDDCLGVDSAQVNYYGEITYGNTLQNASCPETPDGTITVHMTGGSSPFTFSWNTGTADSVLNNVIPGSYVVTITDANGCQKVSDYTLGSENVGCLDIPTAFSPNGDDVNDTWEIENIEMYDQIKIEIYNRWGQLVFSYSGTGAEYSEKSFQWDGTYNGKELPISSFVYILDLFDGNDPLSGIVTIKK